MRAASDYRPQQIASIIVETLAMVSPEIGSGDRNTRLIGSGAVLDSVGLVTLLVSVEQNLGNGIDLAAVFMENADVGEERNPFRTVGSLADHIHQLMSAGRS